MSRPSSRTKEVIDKICLRLANGETLKKICSDSGMPDFATVWRWEQEDEEFCKLSSRARDIGTHHMADDCLTIADDPLVDPADKRIRIDTRIRLIGKWNAKKYGDSTTIKGDKENPIEVRESVNKELLSVLTIEQLEQIRAKALEKDNG